MKRPFVIWVTAVISALVAAASVYGLHRRLDRLIGLYQQTGPSDRWLGCAVIFTQTCFSAFLLAVIYAAFKRPRWARGICCVFAVLLAAWVLYEAIHPDSYPRFPIQPGEQEVGALIGRMLMVALVLVYAYSVMLGRKARAYFDFVIVVPHSPTDTSEFERKH